MGTEVITNVVKDEEADVNKDVVVQKSPKKQKKQTGIGANASPKTSDRDDAEGTKKKHRKRKRHHFNAIRTQMEFYMGDANLSKSKFLKELINKDPYIPIEVFLTFNKLKLLTSSAEEIAKSLSNSELLELDEAQQKIRRKIPLPEERNVDDNTLYVEALPPTADHDWIREMFGRFGNITYVSLPKYKYSKSRKIKEFGFVEFEQASSVEKAVNAFNEFGGVLSMEEAKPEELKSIQAFIKEQTNEESLKKETPEGNAIKKRRKDIDPESNENPLPKRIKIEDENFGANSTVTEDEVATAEESTNDESHQNNAEEGVDSTTKKKRRKKKQKQKTAEKLRKEADLNADASYYELKVLPKRDWKRLRNKYLNLQREKIAELKRRTWKEQQEARQHFKRENAKETVDAASPPPTKKSKPNERNLHKMSMNFYGAGEDEPLTTATASKVNPKDTKQNPALERAPLFNYEPGLIVEINFLEPCVNVKEFKTEMRQHSAVKYIDVKEGSMQAHLRLDSATTAEDFARQTDCAEYKCKVIFGESESEYWKKIEKDREMKLNKQVKVPQKRGREKVKKLISKHIRFGDEGAE